MLILTSCNSKSTEPQGVIVESVTDSITMVNEPAPQTIIFRGTSPMNGNAIANVMLAISTVSLNDDGTYSIITDYIAIGTFTTVISFPVYSAVMMRHYLMAIVVAAASAVVIYKHRENIVRIATGKEIGLRRVRKTPDSHH